MWGQIVLVLLQVAKLILDHANNNKLIEAGADREIAKSSAAILAKTKFAKETMEKINALPRDSVDDLLSRLAENKP